MPFSLRIVDRYTVVENGFKVNVLDLFSGIGGFSLGLERAGMRTVAFCEIDPWCRLILSKHWPSVPCYPDVSELTGELLAADGIAVDLICGGFPCQDISIAGAGAGIDGARSGLWKEYARIIGELRPRYVIVENVSALLGRGLDRVLGDLAALGFDAEWHCIPASAVGAPHQRDRIWILAYPNESIYAGEMVSRRNHGSPGQSEGRDARQRKASYRERLWLELGAGRAVLADTDKAGLAFGIEETLGAAAGHAQPQRQDSAGRQWWAVEPDVGRVADGIPARMDRIGSLGNAVVPQIPEIIGRAIMSELAPSYNDMEKLREKNEQLRIALRFYADGRRYQGSNNRDLIPGDVHQPHDCPYLWSVDRDLGAIARSTLAND